MKCERLICVPNAPKTNLAWFGSFNEFPHCMGILGDQTFRLTAHTSPLSLQQECLPIAMEMLAVAPNENAESLPQYVQTSSGEPQAVGGWWCGGSSFIHVVDTVAKERAERLQFYQIWDQRVGLSIEDLSQNTQELNLIEPLSVTFPPRDFWSSTYCPPQSAAIKLYQYGLEDAPWTRLISWGSINPAKYSWDAWKQ